MVQQETENVSIIEASGTPAEIELLFAWRHMLPENATASKRPPTWEEHVAWFDQQRVKPYFVIYRPFTDEDRYVGVVALSNSFAVSVHIADEGVRGKGVATEALNQLLDACDGQVRQYTAVIHESNEASKRLFAKVGFTHDITIDGWETWLRD